MNDPLYIAHFYYADATAQRAKLQEMNEIVKNIATESKPVVFARHQVAIAFTCSLTPEQIATTFKRSVFPDEVHLLIVRAEPVTGYLDAGAWDWIRDHG